MSRADAIFYAENLLDSGEFARTLSRRIALPTESQNPDRLKTLLQYLDEVLTPDLQSLGFTCDIITHPEAKGPFLLTERIENPERPTVLGYGHGDVVRGMDQGWSEGLSPWTVSMRDGRLYGRGVADNKGQHSINMAALRAVLETRGSLGFNAKYLIEMGEEVHSPGLHAVCKEYRDRLRSDVLIASDGPRLSLQRPTVFLGSRGAVTFDLLIEARERGQHSGNWGGLLSNPGIQLAHAIAALVGSAGQIRVPELVPDHIPEAVRNALADCQVDNATDGSALDAGWGEPGLTAAQKVFGWCNLEVLAFETGTPNAPVNAIPPRAWARMQLRFVVGVDVDEVIPAVRRHLDRHGFPMVQILNSESLSATRLDPEDPWVRWVLASIAETTGKKPALLPNVGGGLPNDAFSEILSLPTIWVPHSYPGCLQHAPDEHLPVSLVREGLAVMAGLYWDLGADDFSLAKRRELPL